jgi:hypothetical protein
MNKRNEKLWKQEQKSNEKEWLTGLVKSTKRQQELDRRVLGRTRETVSSNDWRRNG